MVYISSFTLLKSASNIVGKLLSVNGAGVMSDYKL